MLSQNNICCFRLTLTLSCAMNFLIYPHDTQECKLQMESCKYFFGDCCYNCKYCLLIFEYKYFLFRVLNLNSYIFFTYTILWYSFRNKWEKNVIIQVLILLLHLLSSPFRKILLILLIKYWSGILVFLLLKNLKSWY